MKKVLILTARHGEGHHVATRNFRDAPELLSDEVTTEVLGSFALAYGTATLLVKKACEGLVRHAPGIWLGTYSLLHHSAMVTNYPGTFTPLQKVLRDLLEQTPPNRMVPHIVFSRF